MPKNLKKGIALAVLASIAAPTVSFAQEGLIEEIVVTATKRTQTLQETPVAVTVTTAEVIEKAQILDISDLQSVVPSLRVSQLQNSTNTNFAIRGFGNGANNVGIEPSVGVFVDGVYRSRSAGAISDLPTLERVEVLNGPQSTLFGKNASAGVISVVTAKPSGEFGGKFSATLGNFDARVVKGELEGAISDTVAYKVSGGINQRDGYVTNLETGTDLNDRDRYNLRGQLLLNPNDRTEIRIIADYDKIEEVCCASVNIQSGPVTGILQAIGGNIVANDDNALTTFSNIDPFNDQENYGISAQVDYEFENFNVTSISSYRQIDSFSNIDPDFSSASLLSNDITNDIETFTSEIRITSTNGDKLDWQLGAFYFNEDITVENNLPFGSDFLPFAATSVGIGLGQDVASGAALVAGNFTIANIEGAARLLGQTLPSQASFASGPGLQEFGTLDNESISLFGQFDYHFNDRLTATVGFNYTKDEKEASYVQGDSETFSSIDFTDPALQTVVGSTLALSVPNVDLQAIGAQALLGDPNDPNDRGLQALQFLPPFLDFPNSIESGETDDDELTYTLRLAYDLSDSVNLYASYATGFKASSFNLSRDSRPVPADLALINAAGFGPAGLTSGTRFADPEEAKVFELGLKASFARGSVDVAIFDQTIEDFQSNNFNGLGFNLVNAGEQSTQGIELNATYFPVDALKLTFSGTFLDPEFDSFEGAAIPNPDFVLGGSAPVLIPGDLSGEQPSGINEVSISASATYNFNIGSNDAFLRADYFFEDDVQVIDTILEDIASRETKVLNIAGGISTESGYSFSFWARNLTDHDTLISAFPTTAQAGSFSGYRTPPRTYGITIGKDF